MRFGLALVLLLAGPAAADISLVIQGDKAMQRAVRAASGLSEDGKTALDLYTDAQAEYGRLISALYAMGHYGPVISVKIDGREASTIAPLDAPAQVRSIVVTVDPGPAFAFGALRLAPLAGNTELPEGFKTGEPAYSGTVQDAVTAGIDGWREVGHAKAGVGRQALSADHQAGTLSADITLAPGPVLRFGGLAVSGAKTITPQRIVAMAGLPTGRTFSASEATRAAERLRRSGVFSSVTLSEAEGITPPDILNFSAEVVEAKPRRYTFGAEWATDDGVSVNGSWLHRNIFGGGERLEITGAASNIEAGTSGIDYDLGVSLNRPASLGPDTALSLSTDFSHVNDDDYSANTVTLGAGFTRYFTPTLTGTAGLGASYSRGKDAAGDFTQSSLSVPISVTWDRRDSTTSPTKLFYLNGEVKPFVGFGDTDTGARLAFDARAYKSVGKTVLAARLQGGAVVGASALGTPRDDLFYSGGGGTVRGQPYQSLGFQITRDATSVGIGGTQFAALSLEARVKVTQSIGVVGFVDAGTVAIAGEGDWHAGAGMGLRYETGLGPVRLDLAVPVGGDTGDGLQIYVGLGQAF
ncbi:autotransporter assembly complex protein TamA [Stagnihabitans tardus]|uniref:BamA/TamA family outer membrane protein n=1 Tax=Stagnihabitans tardus TaxID=2699202 RepID=A0AAE4Y8X4_9RHOB|nr:BamA/TamA family outer membrane protein [Stagnihabitans tardus]NBZ86858.1 BamA/TamA family outer membrane protein [Stagnihabitans tardus]